MIQGIHLETCIKPLDHVLYSEALRLCVYMHEIAANRQSRIALRKSLKYFLFQIDCTMYLPLPSPKNLVVSKLTGKSCGIFFWKRLFMLSLMLSGSWLFCSIELNLFWSSTTILILSQSLI